jgi:hypothetical protein
MKKILLIIIVLIQYCSAFSQDYRDMLSPQWDKYYDVNPSGIDDNYQGSDFVRIIEIVDFTPRSSSMFKGDVNLLKKVLFAFKFEALRQLSITGSFYSRTKKHDDYFRLYNLTYKSITKYEWDKYCPYLIPLMEIDGLLKFNN